MNNTLIKPEIPSKLQKEFDIKWDEFVNNIIVRRDSNQNKALKIINGDFIRFWLPANFRASLRAEISHYNSGNFDADKFGEMLKDFYNRIIWC